MSLVLGFRLGSRRYGVDAQSLSGVSYVGPFLDQVPELPRWFWGLTLLGREEAWVVDLGDYLGMEETISARPRTALLTIRRSGQTVGFAVTDVLGTRKVPIGAISPVPHPAETRFNGRLLAGAAELDDHLLVILNLQTLLSDEEWAQLTTALNPVKSEK